MSKYWVEKVEMYTAEEMVEREDLKEAEYAPVIKDDTKAIEFLRALSREV